MLFTCLPPDVVKAGTPIPGRFPGPAHARGKWFSVDIHCHVRTPAAAESVRAAGDAAGQRPRGFASPELRRIADEMQVRVQTQLHSVEKRRADMDVMGIDVQAISPAPDQTYYWTEPDLGTPRRVRSTTTSPIYAHPDRFVGPARRSRPRAGRRRARSAHKSLGMRASRSPTASRVRICPPSGSAYLRQCEELGLSSSCTRPGYSRRRMAVHRQFDRQPLEATVAVHHLILAGCSTPIPG
jgi:aminocarboxymuconate-semialdehyde decarboxylase